MRFAYADPPYFGMGANMYGFPEWDVRERHLALVTQLATEYPDGWALSCNPRDLRWLLAGCPEDCRVGAWVKDYHQIRRTNVQYAWEAVVFRGGRPVLGRNPMIRDWHKASATRMKRVRGAKPSTYCRWILELLGFDAAQDELVDLFPGSGIMGYVAAQIVLM